MRNLLAGCALLALVATDIPAMGQNQSAMKFADAADLMRETALVVAQAEACGATPVELNQAVQGALMRARRPPKDFDALHLVYGTEREALPKQERENCAARVDALTRLRQRAPR